MSPNSCDDGCPTVCFIFITTWKLNLTRRCLLILSQNLQRMKFSPFCTPSTICGSPHEISIQITSWEKVDLGLCTRWHWWVHLKNAHIQIGHSKGLVYRLLHTKLGLYFYNLGPCVIAFQFFSVFMVHPCGLRRGSFQMEPSSLWRSWPSPNKVLPSFWMRLLPSRESGIGTWWNWKDVVWKLTNGYWCTSMWRTRILRKHCGVSQHSARRDDTAKVFETIWVQRKGAFSCGKWDKKLTTYKDMLL